MRSRSAGWRMLVMARWGFAALAIAWGGLWVASVWWWMRWEPMQGHALMVSRGAIGLGRPAKPPGVRMGNTIRAAPKDEPMHWRTFRTGTWVHNTTWRPLWMHTSACAAVAGVLWLPALRRRPRWACAACGYDLRGLTEGVVCPECGAIRSAGGVVTPH